ncbi:hypothetical protein PMAYCL1PPCAC_22598 [Pristionchus mayeri]|uniref:Uncharacterized protein n=1 Tax=Pristionchus mayeri TaxID=1317129 RepID=A0AAN5CX17_9BILA|nr:hypothetical protein PMAYCL1PPCAC_22598 [Pristionchus mayeri]
MNSRSLFIFTILGLLLVSSLDAAKAAKGKKGNASEYTAAQKPKDDAVVVEESSVIDEIPAPKILRPKTLKFVSAYVKCKMECQKIRDQQGLHSYAAQLREELAAAEAALGEAALLEETQSAVVA